MEATSIYSFHPAYFLSQDDDLAQFDVDIVVINPRETKNITIFLKKAKLISLMPFISLTTLDFSLYKVGLIREEQYVALHRLIHTRYEMVQDLVRDKQHFLETLYYKANKPAIDD